MTSSKASGLEAPRLKDVVMAGQRLRGRILRTPLVRLDAPGLPAEIHLKLENLQPGGSFKLRPALNALLSASPETLSRGVYTASAGNMAQGLALGAKALGVRLRVYAPDSAAPVKIARLRALDAEVILLPFADWWRILADHGHEGEEGHFVHPAAQPATLAGDGTIALEILEDLPDVDTIVAPFGAGGLCCGIAAAAKAVNRHVRVLACETTAGTPVAASLAAGEPVEVDFKPDAFLMGVGAARLLPEMWPLVSTLLDGTVCVDRAAVAQAVRLGFERVRTVMEGAGAAAVAAAIGGQAKGGKVVAVVSGGNIDRENFVAAIEDRTP